MSSASFARRVKLLAGSLIIGPLLMLAACRGNAQQSGHVLMRHSPVRGSLRGPLFLSIIALAIVIGACSGVTSVPPAGQDKAPLIHISAFVVGGSGTVEKTPVSKTSTIHVTANTKVMLSGNAYNPLGGVAQFSLSVTQGGTPLYTVEATGVRDGNGNAPVQLDILGSDGAGKPGGKVALLYTMDATHQVTVVAKATNFNQMTTAITVTYVPGLVVGPPPIVITQSGIQNAPDGQFLVTQGLSGETFVAGKHLLTRIFLTADQAPQVTSLSVNLSGPNAFSSGFTVSKRDLVVETKAPNGPSVGFILPGSLIANSGYYSFGVSARDQWGEEIRQAPFSLTAQPTKDLRLLVVFQSIQPKYNFLPDATWTQDITNSMLRLAAMYPVRDGVQNSLNGATTAGLRYVIGSTCDGYATNYYSCVYDQARAINKTNGDHVDITVEYRPGLYAPTWNPPGDPNPGGNAGRPPAPYDDLPRASCVAGRWNTIEMTAPCVAQEIAHNFGLETLTDPHSAPNDPRHSKDPFITDPYAYDFVNARPYGGQLDDTMCNLNPNGAWAGADKVALSAYDWEYMRGGLLNLNSTGTN